MDCLSIRYSRKSPAKLARRDRVMLLSSAFGIVVGFLETWTIYRGVAILVPICGFAVAFVNVVVAILFHRLRKRYSGKFELFLNQSNGVALFITGLGFHIAGSRYLQYAYYLLSFFIMFVFPFFYQPSKKKRFSLDLSAHGIAVRRPIFRSNDIPWDRVEQFILDSQRIRVEMKDSGKVQNYYLIPENDDPDKIRLFLKQLKKNGIGPGRLVITK